MQIGLAEQCHITDIVDFHYTMAMETQTLDLDKEVIEKAISFLISHPKYGMILVPVQPECPEQVCGSLLVSYENETSWWIASVFVRKENRRQGIFTSLFQKLIDQAKKKGVTKVQLYAQNDNDKAMATYQKLGMIINKNKQFFGYELVFGDSQMAEELSTPIKETYKLEIEEPGTNSSLDGLEHVSGSRQDKNKGLLLYSQGTLIGYCQFYHEYSEWRFSLTAYLNTLWTKPGFEVECMHTFMKYLCQNCDLKLGAVRLIATEQEGIKLKQLQPELYQSKYTVLEIDL